jgi:hypothetical protein
MIKALLLAALIAASALLTAGCGGGSDAPRTTTAAPKTHAAFATAANAACRTASTSMGRLPAATTLPDLATYAQRARAVGVSLERELAAIVAPAADRDAFARYRASLRTADAALATMKTAAEQNDRGGVRTAVQRITAAQVGILATQAGLGTCATATGGTAP